MVTRAPTYTFSSSNPALFRNKGGSLSDKLYQEFRQIETMAASGMQCSAATLFGGGMYCNVFNWTNPIAPTPIIVDHLIIRIRTASSAAGSRMIICRATNTGAGQNSCALANRALAANTWQAASRKDIATGLPLTSVTLYDSRMVGATSFQRSSTLLYGAYQYLTSRAINASPSVVAGTVYVFWHKAYNGAA